MKNVVLATAVVAVMSSFGSFASAASFNNSCGPTAEFGIDQDLNDTFSGQTERVSLGFKIKWTLGAAHKRQCNELNSTVVSQEYHKNRELAAEARQEEADLLAQRIKICSDFTSETAPQSIANFCGDLLPK